VETQRDHRQGTKNASKDKQKSQPKTDGLRESRNLCKDKINKKKFENVRKKIEERKSLYRFGSD